MPSFPNALADFVRACQRRYGQDFAQCNDEGAFVFVDDVTVHVRQDGDADRIVLWTDLDMPAGVSLGSLEHVAMDYTASRFLEAGFVMGVNRVASLIALGRSVDAGVLKEEQAFDMMQSLAREAPAAASRLKQARVDSLPSKGEADDLDALTIRG